MDTPTPSLREQGVQALREGNLDGAVDLLARAVMADGQDAEAQAFLGVAYSQKGLHAQAKRALETAISLRPQEPRFHFNEGVALEAAGDLQGAAAAYQETLRLNPQHPQARARLQGLGAPSAASMAAPATPSPYGQPDVSAAPPPWAAGQQPAASTSAPAASVPWEAGQQPAAAGPPGTVQCPSCKQWSRPGMSCEWCSAPLKTAAAPQSAPWLQSPSGAGADRAADYSYSAGPEMATGEAFGRRFVAVLIDGIIMLIPLGALMAASVASMATSPNPEAAGGAMQGIFWLAYIVISLIYSAGMLAWRGQTLGKMAMGIRVVGPDGNHPSFWRAALREVIGKWISQLILNLGYLWMLWDPEQQTWHDKIAGTTVDRA
jgi:uncharacterized RDD family membrane protein YckC